MSDNRSNVGILGAGTWGIALAKMLSDAGRRVTVWSALPDEVAQLEATNEHPKLPGVTLPSSIAYTTSIETACTGRDIVVFAVPSVFIRSTARAASAYMPHAQIAVSVAKGIETDTLCTMTDILAEELNEADVRLVALAGPTHAEEVARSMRSAIVSASKDTEAACIVQEAFSTSVMRVYTSSDIRGTEVCGAIKNVIALAAGIAKGCGCGANAKAALITRGLAEMKRLGAHMGCEDATFSGLTGMGDLIVTCTSDFSRNNQAGVLIGQGLSAQAATEKVGMVVEGLNALPAVVKLMGIYHVEMPIASAVDDVVSGRMTPDAAIDSLFRRDLKAE